MREKFILTDNRINKTLLNQKIRDNSLHEYHIINRLEFIDELINWIAEAKNSNRELMKEDLTMLIQSKDLYMFSSNLTNSYIGKADSDFEKICEELLQINADLD